MAIIKHYGTLDDDSLWFDSEGSPDTVIQLYGRAGDDWLFSTIDRRSFLFGGEGHDTLLGGDLGGRLFGENGDDVLVAGRSGASWLNGGAGNDDLASQGGSDYLEGGDGDDSFSAGGGEDTIVGGAGTDSFSMSSTHVLRLDLSITGPQYVGSSIKYISGIENAHLGDHGDHQIIGSRVDNHLSTWTGKDTLFGLGGNDTLEGNGGDDLFYGGGGDDLILGGAGDDSLFGQEGNDTLSGGAGEDVFVFRGKAGADVIRAFQPDEDIIRFDYGGGDFADVAITDLGDHALVSFRSAGITLRNVDPATLDAGDFLFL